MITHFIAIEYWEPRRPRAYTTAICGCRVEQQEFSPSPTCPECRDLVAQQDAEDRQTAQAVGVTSLEPEAR